MDNDRVLMQGDLSVWKTDSHDAVVAFHPHTHQQLTIAAFHRIISDIAAGEGKIDNEVLDHCKEMGAHSHQDCLNILFPAQLV